MRRILIGGIMTLVTAFGGSANPVVMREKPVSPLPCMAIKRDVVHVYGGLYMKMLHVRQTARGLRALDNQVAYDIAYFARALLKREIEDAERDFQRNPFAQDLARCERRMKVLQGTLIRLEAVVDDEMRNGNYYLQGYTPKSLIDRIFQEERARIAVNGR